MKIILVAALVASTSAINMEGQPFKGQQDPFDNKKRYWNNDFEKYR